MAVREQREHETDASAVQLLPGDATPRRRVRKQLTVVQPATALARQVLMAHAFSAVVSTELPLATVTSVIAAAEPAVEVPIGVSTAGAS